MGGSSAASQQKERMGRPWREQALCLLAGCALMALTCTALVVERAQSLIYAPVEFGGDVDVVGLTVLDRAEEAGAVCLDGSPPSMYMRRGHGAGRNRWLVFHEGGGWCTSLEDCAARAETRLGSTARRPVTARSEGMLSGVKDFNPDFYNWNIVHVNYCDGASYAGNVADPVSYKGRRLYFRGLRVWKAVMEDLLSRGMANATHALLTGCSAGGLGTMLHCNRFRTMFPQQSTVVKCMPDAGFFIDAVDIAGQQDMKNIFLSVSQMQNPREALDPRCTKGKSKSELAQCLSPEHILPTISTPIFLLQSTYDNWQIANIYAPDAADPKNEWKWCKGDIEKCSPQQLDKLGEYRQQLLDAMWAVTKLDGSGAFVPSCFIHCQAIYTASWLTKTSVTLGGKTIAEAVGDWYWERTVDNHFLDCKYPCNKSCLRW